MPDSTDNVLDEKLMQAEGWLVQGQAEAARDLLLALAEDAEEYVSRNCPTTNETQWFSFPTLFERLAYRRVEEDPRELLDVGEPLDRLYADLALADVHLGDYDHAIEALKQAVRWNPMGCEHRLNLAELCRVAGDMQEYLGLSFSVFERASEAAHLVRAYLNFSEYFRVSENPRAAAACLHVAQSFGTDDSALASALELAADTDADPAGMTDGEAAELLEAEGLPAGANADVAICLLMCAGDAAAAGERNVATNLTLRARDLVGEKACMALLELINGDDEGEGDANGR